MSDNLGGGHGRYGHCLNSCVFHSDRGCPQVPQHAGLSLAAKLCSPIPLPIFHLITDTLGSPVETSSIISPFLQEALPPPASSPTSKPTAACAFSAFPAPWLPPLPSHQFVSPLPPAPSAQPSPPQSAVLGIPGGSHALEGCDSDSEGQHLLSAAARVPHERSGTMWSGASGELRLVHCGVYRVLGLNSC